MCWRQCAWCQSVRACGRPRHACAGSLGCLFVSRPVIFPCMSAVADGMQRLCVGFGGGEIGAEVWRMGVLEGASLIQALRQALRQDDQVTTW